MAPPALHLQLDNCILPDTVRAQPGKIVRDLGRTVSGRMEVSVTCSCSRQIAAGEHARRGEVLLLFGFAPCECAAGTDGSAPHVTEPEAHGVKLGPAFRTATWGQIEFEIQDWIMSGTGHALLVGTQALSLPNQHYRRFASLHNIRCTSIRLDELGFDCTDALGNVISTGRRLYLRHVNHNPTYFYGKKLTRAWVHANSTQWLKIAQSCVLVDNGEVIEWS